MSSMDLYASIIFSVCLIFSFIYFLVLCKFSLKNAQIIPGLFYAFLAVLTGVAISISFTNWISETLPIWGVLVVVLIIALLFKQSFNTLKLYIESIERKVKNAKAEVHTSQVQIKKLEERITTIINDISKEE